MVFGRKRKVFSIFHWLHIYRFTKGAINEYKYGSICQWHITIDYIFKVKYSVKIFSVTFTKTVIREIMMIYDLFYTRKTKQYEKTFFIFVWTNQAGWDPFAFCSRQIGSLWIICLHYTFLNFHFLSEVRELPEQVRQVGIFLFNAHPFDFLSEVKELPRQCTCFA